MARSNVIVRLSLKDHETVVRGLQNAGAEGERALKRIEAASRAPSVGRARRHRQVAAGVAAGERRGGFRRSQGQLTAQAARRCARAAQPMTRVIPSMLRPLSQPWPEEGLTVQGTTLAIHIGDGAGVVIGLTVEDAYAVGVALAGAA